MKKLNTLKLLGILIILLLIYGATEFFGTTGRSRSFREELVSIDTAKVSKIEITNEGQKLEIVENEDGWTVSTNGGPKYNATETSVKRALSSLQTIKPSRVASRNKEKWQEFQVDSTGTRVQVFEGDKEVLDLVIGRFGMQGQQQFHSYVRLYDDNSIYVAENFMGFSVPSEESSYRNQIITDFSRDSVNSLQFIYQGDSSFMIRKDLNGEWVGSDFEADSTKTAQFINSLARINNSKFENESEITGLGSSHQVVVDVLGVGQVDLRAFPKTDSTFIITSSQNLEGRFEDQALFDKIFKSKESFYSEDPN